MVEILPCNRYDGDYQVIIAGDFQVIDVMENSFVAY